jgi:hypothetical protein
VNLGMGLASESPRWTISSLELLDACAAYASDVWDLLRPSGAELLLPSICDPWRHTPAQFLATAMPNSVVLVSIARD